MAVDGSGMVADGSGTMADGSGTMADGSGMMVDGSGMVASTTTVWHSHYTSATHLLASLLSRHFLS